MEPDNLKSLSPDDARLEAWLRVNASLPQLPDDGFSRRVLAVLPPASRKARVAERRRVVLCGAGVGVVVAVFLYLAGTPGDFVWPTAGPAAGDLLAKFADPKLPVALGVALVTLCITFRREVCRWVRI